MGIGKWIFDTFDMLRYCPIPERVIEPAEILGTISVDRLRSIMPQFYKNNDGEVKEVNRAIFMDREYCLTSVEEITRFLKWSMLNYIPYERVKFDCNRFAVKLWGDVPAWTPGLLMGYGHKRGHGCNWFMDANGVFWELNGTWDRVDTYSDEIYWHWA